MAKEWDKDRDLLDWVGPDISASVFCLFDHPADLLRASAVRRSWRRFGPYLLLLLPPPLPLLRNGNGNNNKNPCLLADLDG